MDVLVLEHFHKLIFAVAGEEGSSLGGGSNGAGIDFRGMPLDTGAVDGVCGDVFLCFRLSMANNKFFFTRAWCLFALFVDSCIHAPYLGLPSSHPPHNR
jgi:hypothetical protein